MEQNYLEVESQSELREIILRGGLIRKQAFQNLDFTREPIGEDVSFEDCIFLGCALPQALRERVAEGCYLFPRMDCE